jgi:hypothetical protein
MRSFPHAVHRHVLRFFFFFFFFES